MPLRLPEIDSRNFQQLVDETLARVPIHTPEWTNFGPSDPGVTLVQLYAFLTENLIYRANQIPMRNRAKFLDLLQIGLRTASAARGLATITNVQAPAAVEMIAADLELLAGKFPFRTTRGLHVLPVEGQLFVKRPLSVERPELLSYYKLLYASYDSDLPAETTLYETAPVAPGETLIDFSTTIDHSLWIALVAREEHADRTGEDRWATIRQALAGRTLSLGLAPSTDVEQRILRPGNGGRAPADLLVFEMPQTDGEGMIGLDEAGVPDPRYRRIEARADFDPLTECGVVELALPSADGLRLWRNLDPLEAGVGELPPSLEGDAAADRVVTWLRVRATGGAHVRLRWAGINATPIRQIERVLAERLPDGDGTPDQVRRLARAPVLAGSVRVMTTSFDRERTWSEIDDLLAAGPEVPVAGAPPTTAPTDVFLADHEAGVLRFGDGLAGRRLPVEARVFADYLYSEGAEGNVSAGAIKDAPLLPAGFAATNPIATWGGADAETVAEGEKQVRRMIQHRERLVTAEDFVTIAWRAPGITIGRVEVLPAWHPSLAPAAIGVAPGVVTLLAIPRHDPAHPQAPRADRPFLDALCRHLDPRRLVTTELVLRGPAYRGIWISVGVEVAGGVAIAETTEAVRQCLRAFLSPLPPAGLAEQQAPLYGSPPERARLGWRLNEAVHARVLMAEAARVPGVVSVADVLLSEGGGPAVPSIPINGIELPELLGISVVQGAPVDLALLRGDPAPSAADPSRRRLPVPAVVGSC
jgi:predicted phage baseplate assembly protein